MVRSGHFDPRTGNKWNTTHKTATPKVKKGVVQSAVKEDIERDDKDKKTVLPSYTQILKANGFIHVSAHGGANREESKSFDGDAVYEFGIGRLKIDDAFLPGTTSHEQGVIFDDAGQCVVQGRGGTNPVNNKHSQVKNKGTIHTVKSKGTITLDMGGEKPVLDEIPTDRFTLDKCKCYLDS